MQNTGFGRLSFRQGLFLLLLFVALILLLFVRLRYIHQPLERDEGEYAYAGSLILHGKLPYKDAYNMKFPGTYFMYSLLMAIGSECIEAIRYGVFVIVMLTAFGVYGIVRLMHKNTVAANVASLTFVALVGTMEGEGLMANSEHFVNLFAVWGIWALMRYRAGKKVLFVIAGGALLAMAVVMKQHGYAFTVFGMLLLLHTIYNYRIAAKLRVLAAFAVGYLFVLAILALWVFGNGLGDKFVFLTVKYAYAYLGLSRAGVPGKVIQLTSGAPAIWALTALCLLIVFLKFRKNVMVITWLAFSIVALSTGFYFRLHYFILAYPALAAIAGCGYFYAARFREDVASLTVAFCFAVFFIAQRDVLFMDKPENALSKHYKWGMFKEMPAVGNYVRNLIPQTERLSIFSNEPELLFYANRVSASGYIYNYPLFECQPYGPAMVEEYKQQIMANPSKLFVYQSGDLQICNQPEFERFECWRLAFLNDYRLVSVYRAVTEDSASFISESEIAAGTWRRTPHIEFWMRDK